MCVHAIFWFRKFCFFVKKSVWNFFLLCLYLKSNMKVFLSFQTLQVSFWNIRSFLNLDLESSISRNIRNILRVVFFFIFWARKVIYWNIRKHCFQKCKKCSVMLGCWIFLSWKLGEFRFLKIRGAFFEKIKKFLSKTFESWSQKMR